jgi:hypothetical protein
MRSVEGVTPTQSGLAYIQRALHIISRAIVDGSTTLLRHKWKELQPKQRVPRFTVLGEVVAS